MDDAVGEGQAVAFRPEHACLHTALGQAGRPGGVEVLHPADEVDVERVSGNGGDPEELLDLVAGPAYALDDDLPQRPGHLQGVGRPVGVGGQAERFDREQHVAAGEAVDRLGQLRHAHHRRQPLHRRLRERAELDAPTEVLECLDRVTRLLGAKRHQQQEALVTEAAGHEPEGLEGRRPGVLQVLDDEEGGLALGQAGDQLGDGFERPAVLELGSDPLVGTGLEEVGQPWQQLGQRARPVAGQLAGHFRSRLLQMAADGLEDGLEEQRPFGLVAAGSQGGAAAHLDQSHHLGRQP